MRFLGTEGFCRDRSTIHCLSVALFAHPCVTFSRMDFEMPAVGQCARRWPREATSETLFDAWSTTLSLVNAAELRELTDHHRIQNLLGPLLGARCQSNGTGRSALSRSSWRYKVQIRGRTQRLTNSSVHHACTHGWRSSVAWRRRRGWRRR